MTNPNPALWKSGSAATAIRSAQVDCVNGLTMLQRPDSDTVRGSGPRTGAHCDTVDGAMAVAQLWADTIAALAA
jgi:hypothetical protein